MARASRQPSACASSSFPSDARGQGRGHLRSREAFALARLLIRSGETTPGGLATARPASARVTQPADAGPDAIGGQAYRAARRAAKRWALLVAAGWLLQVGVRAWFSRGQSVPLTNPDESAYLIAARVLAGGPATDFSYSTLYQ